ncbi:hypothetical protein [Streptomyces sp. SID4956]|uniref:hypothetical protein n=1 Tax=Streptomyces sp. SID4956 TaxID=2690290 RepID=UPI00136E88C8|nr:hypothetical protein [Streptomyces sp. SID4956]
MRIRVVVVNAAALAVILVLTVSQGDSFKDEVIGPFNLGMLLLGAQGLVILASAVLYDRACTTHCDPRVDELHAARAAEVGPVAEHGWGGRR